jgi:hypothetical protein
MISCVLRVAGASLVLAGLAAGGAAIAMGGSTGAPVTKSEAVAFIHAVNLTPTDLPGAKELDVPSTPQAPSERPRPDEGSLAQAIRCTHSGIVRHRPIDEATSLLVNGPNLVGSLVRVMPTEAVAAAELAAFASRRGHVCFARSAKVEVTAENEPHEDAEPVKTTFVPLVKLLGKGAIGVHTLSRPEPAAKQRRPAAPATIHTDGALFRVGPAEILFITVGRRQFPPATEGRLLALLHSRAEAHKL